MGTVQLIPICPDLKNIIYKFVNILFQLIQR